MRCRAREEGGRGESGNDSRRMRRRDPCGIKRSEQQEANRGREGRGREGSDQIEGFSLGIDYSCTM